MRIALVAGETSGDQLGAGLIKALAKRFPQAEFVGIGGPRMRRAGIDAWWDADELAVMGLAEVLQHLPRLLRLRRALLKRLHDTPPDIFIGIDAPDFTLGVERAMRRAGVCTVHYVSPSIWAWRPGRAAKVGAGADLVLCLFPFEPALYAAHGVKAAYVGHPLADAFPLDPAPRTARAMLRLPFDVPTLAILPGSRRSEIDRLSPVFLDVARTLKAEIPRLTVLAPMANSGCASAFRKHLRNNDSVMVLTEQAQLALQAADAVLLASGTAALEAALARRPMVVAYKLHWFTHWMVTRFHLLKSRWFSLPNQLAQAQVVPELAQDAVRVDVLVPMLREMLLQPADATQQAAFARIHQQLKTDADELAASAIAQLWQQRHALQA